MIAGVALILQLAGNLELSAQAHTFVPPNHWTRSALHHLALTGATELSTTALSWPASREEIAEWLSAADRPDDPRVLLFQRVLEGELGTQRRINARLAAGAVSRTGVLHVGTMQEIGQEYVYPGPLPAPDLTSALASAEVYGTIAGPFDVGVQGTVFADDAQLDAAYLGARFGRVEAWAGRRALSFGHAGRESLVLSENAVFDGGGISVRRGLRVPLLRRIYPELVLARIERSGSIQQPWFHAARLTIAPASALSISLSRAVLFGGENHIGVSPSRILLMLVGLPDAPGKDSDFENQVASLDILFRTRIGETPVGMYAEVGADDSGWGFLHVPAFVAGAEIARVPGLPTLAVGLEIVHIAEHCCGYPPWYQHGALADGWADRGRLLGHSLGGAGTQLAAQWRLDLIDLPLLTAGRFFVRDRAPENLLSPERVGRSLGGRFELLAPWRRAQLQLRAEAEFGAASWQTTSLSVLASLAF